MSLVVPSAQKVKPAKNIKHKVFQVPYEAETTAELIAKTLIEKGTSLEVISNMNDMHRVLCECILNNTDLLDDLKGCDLIVHDSVAACPVLVAEFLGIKRVEVYRDLRIIHLCCTTWCLCLYHMFLNPFLDFQIK